MGLKAGYPMELDVIHVGEQCHFEACVLVFTCTLTGID